MWHQHLACKQRPCWHPHVRDDTLTAQCDDNRMPSLWVHLYPHFCAFAHKAKSHENSGLAPSPLTGEGWGGGGGAAQYPLRPPIPAFPRQGGRRKMPRSGRRRNFVGKDQLWVRVPTRRMPCSFTLSCTSLLAGAGS